MNCQCYVFAVGFVDIVAFAVVKNSVEFFVLVVLVEFLNIYQLFI